MTPKSMALAAAITASAMAMTGSPAKAGTYPMIGEIMIVAFDYCPVGWEEAKGQILSIARNEALFSLIGDTYFGGDGSTAFGLPDLRGRSAMGAGQGPGLSERRIGKWFGEQFGRDAAAAADDNDNTQEKTDTPPALVLRHCIAVDGVFPSRN